MELRIVQYHKNKFQLRALLIKGESPTVWLREIQILQLSLADIQLYPLPGVKPNTVWGCFLIFGKEISKSQAGRHELCQMVFPNLYIPERSDIFPQVTQAELQRLFSTGICIAHPALGFVEVTEPLDPGSLIERPIESLQRVVKPSDSNYTPLSIRSFQVQPIPKEEVLKNLSENIFPKQEKMKDRPLNPLEKLRLGFYKIMFRKEQSVDGKSTIEKTGLASKLQSLFSSENKWQSIEEDFEDLERRNQKQIDRLMDLLKNNPEEGLKYAIPLDNDGTTRGGQVGKFTLSKRWMDFSLFGSSGIQSGGGIVVSDNFYELQRQYHSTAEEMMRRNDYQKAAFIYLKLLKNHDKAAEALEAGRYYQEAAAIYLQRGNKIRAAACYEKGNMTTEAIALYIDLNDHEKVGDLYMAISNRQAAMIHYQKVVDEHKTKERYMRAALLSMTKMEDSPTAQSLLLTGWRTNRDAANCLGAYFSNISDENDLHRSIHTIYKTEVTKYNREPFLRVIQSLYRKHDSQKEFLREMAFEIVAEELAKNPSIASELNYFNPNNKEFMKDALRFRLRKK